ncbi:PREDICTED: uncharacterized protein LOC109131349 [Camelina sativa]|uniref:Uncharacterized protein LOC109131349 n=1 Tax=Camelina sativa TaxID=90675 RepID=A0ABM1RFH5_CAMSA|nr:PREDICTED: uncharacterized protein LOC109131349 [Camelina sativa]
MEKKNMFMLWCMIVLLVGSSLMFERVDCRAVRSELFRDINGHHQSTVTIMKVKNSSYSRRPLMRILASGPSGRGTGH